MNARSLQGNSPEEINARFPAFLTDGFQPTLPGLFVCIQKDRIDRSDRLIRKGIELPVTTALSVQACFFQNH